jgi:type VI secretion system protein ImpE
VKAKDLLEFSQLSAAVADLTQDVKAHPTDTHLRTFLFELLCFQGEYQRAGNQLDVIGLKDEKAGIGIEVYRQLLQAEITRRRVFTGAARPTFLLDPPQHVLHQLDGIACLQLGQAGEAKALFAQAGILRPRCEGVVNGHSFTAWRDSDDRISSILEVLIRETYAWIPFEQIHTVRLEPPRQLRDLLWAPITIEVEGGQGGEAFVPVLYAGSEHDDNEQVRLGRLTDWINLGEGIAGGVGQRTFIMDIGERSLLEIRDLTMQQP